MHLPACTVPVTITGDDGSDSLQTRRTFENKIIYCKIKSNWPTGQQLTKSAARPGDDGVEDNAELMSTDKSLNIKEQAEEIMRNSWAH